MSDYGADSNSQYDGLQTHVPDMETPEIENWEFQYPGSETDLFISIPEFSCFCPKTGLPDYATIEIEYQPDKLCLELKSLKEYIFFYRDIGIFHEHVVNRMLNDYVKACDPIAMTVTGVFNARGGIQTTAVANYHRDDQEKTA